MIDLFNIPNSQDNMSIFYANGSAWQTWKKPRKCQYIWIMCIGSGGGGASGSSGTSAANTGGGSGAVTRALFNASLLPDILFIQIGVGGNPGSLGNRSFVSITANTTTTNLVVVSGTVAASGGQTGDSGITAAGETAATTTSAALLSLSNFISTPGVSTTGFVGIPASFNITPLTSQITSPGAPGAGQPADNSGQYNGGSILLSTISPLISGGTGSIVSGATAGNGADGITSWKPFFSTGGAGGGSTVNTSSSGFGGNGGKGGIGSGGGAGGSGRTNAGNGGKGGDGLVIIVSF